MTRCTSTSVRLPAQNSVVFTRVIFNCVHIHSNCWVCKEVNCGLSFSKQAESYAQSNSFPTFAPDLLSPDLVIRHRHLAINFGLGTWKTKLRSHVTIQRELNLRTSLGCKV